MINIGLSPNLRKEDSWLAFKMLFQPWRWKKGKALGELEDWFKNYTGMESVAGFNSGRSAEYGLLKAFGLKEGDEVLLQAFTCVAVPNSVLWTGAKPVYVDIDQSLTMDPLDLERKITQKAKAVIVQYTFGNLADLKEISQICKKHGLVLIEDCAHTIKRDIKGDVAFFSFGRDKVVSSVFGGVGVIRGNKQSFSANKRRKGEWGKSLDFPSYFWIFQQLLHPVASALILPLYDLGVGKILLWTLQKLHLLSFPVYQEEKKGLRPKDFPKKMPNALAELALAQLAKLEEFEEKRKEISKIYEKELENLERKGYLKKISELKSLKVSWLRYPILVEKPEELRKFAKKRGIILGNWYANVIDPKGTDFGKIGYQKGSCPVAEEIAGKIVNLSTYPRMSEKDAYKVVDVIKEYLGSLSSPTLDRVEGRL